MFKINGLEKLCLETVGFCEDFFVFMYVFQRVMLKVASDVSLNYYAPMYNSLKVCSCQLKRQNLGDILSVQKNQILDQLVIVSLDDIKIK